MKRHDFFETPHDGFLFVELEMGVTYNYYGYQDIYGAVIIEREEVATGKMLYYYTESIDYTTAWTARATTTYTLPAVAFAALLS